MYSSSSSPSKLRRHNNSQHQSREDATCMTVLAARNKPFAVPKALIHLPFFNVSCEVADSAPGCVSMLVTKTPPTDIHQQQQLIEMMQKQQQSAESNNNSDQQQQQQQQYSSSSGGGAATTSTANFSLEPSSMIIERITHFSATEQKDKISAWRTARFLKLINLIHPQLCPNILPVIASYRYRHDHAFISRTAAPTSSNRIVPCSATSPAQTLFLNKMTTTSHQQQQQQQKHDPSMMLSLVSNNNSTLQQRHQSSSFQEDQEEALYICQPHMEETLASAARAAPTTLITPNQLRVITRELLDAMSILHKNNIAILDLNPTNVRVNLALKSRSDVAICLSRPVLGGVPMKSRDFLRLLDLPQFGHRYLAPEVVSQVANAMTSKSTVVGDADIFSLPDASTITVSTASDIWSLGCLLAELALGRPLFPSNSIFDHAAVVSQVLSQPFPDLSSVLNQQVPQMVNAANRYYSGSPTSPLLQQNERKNSPSHHNQGGDAGGRSPVTSHEKNNRSLNDTLSGTYSGTQRSQQQQQQSSSSSSRLGLFSGIQISSHIQTAFHNHENSFKQLIAAMLHMDPSQRPSAEDVIRSPFVSMTSVGASGASGSMTATRQHHQHGGGGSSTISGGGHHHQTTTAASIGTRVFGGRRNSGNSSNLGMKPQQRGGHQNQNQRDDNMDQQHNNTMGTGRNRSSADFPIGGGGLLTEFGHEWAIASPEDIELIEKEIEEVAPLMQ